MKRSSSDATGEIVSVDLLDVMAAMCGAIEMMSGVVMGLASSDDPTADVDDLESRVRELVFSVDELVFR